MLILIKRTTVLSNYPTTKNKFYLHEDHFNYENGLVKPFKNKTKLNYTITGSNKHFPPAIKEWKNSTYAFNKNTLKTLASKDYITERLIKNYFLFYKLKNRPRSRRMRNLRKKFSTNRLFISKPEIKQTSDKAIITIFTFNRERRFLIKKLFYYNRRRDILHLWVENNKLTYKYNDSLINFKYLNDNANKSKNYVSLDKQVSRVTQIKIKENINLSTQFSSSLISKKDKISLYQKLLSNVHNKIYKSKLNKIKTYSPDKKKSFYFKANKSKLKRYNKNRKKIFKKIFEMKKQNYTRKKMKGFIAKPFRLTRKRKDLNRKLKRFVRYSGIKLKSEMNFLSFKLFYKNKDFAYARKLFYFYFLRYVLSIFNIKLYAFKDSNVVSNDIIKNVVNSDEYISIEKEIKKDRKGKRNKKSKFIYSPDKKVLRLFKSPLSLTPQGTKIKLYFYNLKKDMKAFNKIKQEKTNENIGELVSRVKPIIININLLDNNNEASNLSYVLSSINFVISQFLNKVLIKSGVLEKERKLYTIFKKLTKRYFKKLVHKNWKKDVMMKNYYIKLMINRFKFSKFLPNLKLLISKIYNKKVELNIVSLKYSHLNTDIFTQLIALKLRKRMNLLKVIKKAFNLAKKPKSYLDKSKLAVNYNINEMANFNIYNSLKIKNLRKNNLIDNLSLQNILEKVYPRSLVNNSGYIKSDTKNLGKIRVITSKTKNILNTIKYKALAGIRIEAAGRLTRRYTASRALFKVKHKGNFQNIDYSSKIKYLKKSMPTVMIRNQVKPNTQYSINSSKRRIGAFGVKGWISGY